jgi:hypothetical protein
MAPAMSRRFEPGSHPHRVALTDVPADLRQRMMDPSGRRCAGGGVAAPGARALRHRRVQADGFFALKGKVRAVTNHRPRRGALPATIDLLARPPA